ncbi:MAG: hypothetical protein LC753_00950 [Acidobacteria bacterium]|nr:hypothetical protein [Acidobacteriota bacterium]MCA1648882.1 hypothetical protein [Acidobacteriota bacterium]
MNIRGACATVCLPLVALLSACTPDVDLKQTLQIIDSGAGWHDAGIVGGKNRLVPSVTFRVRKTTDANLRGLSLNVVFRRHTPGTPATEEEFDDVFVQNVSFAEGNQTAPITARPEAGYTGDPPQSRAEMLQNSQFRDVRARVFAKIGASQWVELSAIDVPRVLLTK